MTIFYFILGAFLRRWYGGCLEDYKILRNRGVQTVCMMAVFMSIYIHDISSWKSWIGALIVTCWLQFEFWSRGHGACFDEGRGIPDDKTIGRYNERWYHYPVDWLFHRVFKLPEEKYGFLYDFLYMGLRYTCPMLVMAYFLDWHYAIIGALVSPIYAFCWTLSEREKWIFDGRVPFVHGATSLAERIVGGIVYGGCFWIQHGFFWW